MYFLHRICHLCKKILKQSFSGDFSCKIRCVCPGLHMAHLRNQIILSTLYPLFRTHCSPFSRPHFLGLQSCFHHKASPWGKLASKARLKRMVLPIHRIYPYNYQMTKDRLTPLSQKLRRQATREENHLWYDFLSHYPVRFLRQKVIGDFIVDFYCHQAKLAIELDGSQHYEEKGLITDDTRTEELKKNGIFVLRILNSEIWNNFSGVCIAIENAVKTRMGWADD